MNKQSYLYCHPKFMFRSSVSLSIVMLHFPFYLLVLLALIWSNVANAAFVNVFLGSDSCSPEEASSIFTVELPSTSQCAPTSMRFSASMVCEVDATNTTNLVTYVTHCDSDKPRSVFTQVPERECHNHTSSSPESFQFLCDPTEASDLTTPFPIYFTSSHQANRYVRQRRRRE